jgi:hypothetical protein
MWAQFSGWVNDLIKLLMTLHCLLNVEGMLTHLSHFAIVTLVTHPHVNETSVL